MSTTHSRRELHQAYRRQESVDRLRQEPRHLVAAAGQQAPQECVDRPTLRRRHRVCRGVSVSLRRRHPKSVDRRRHPIACARPAPPAQQQPCRGPAGRLGLQVRHDKAKRERQVAKRFERRNQLAAEPLGRPALSRFGVGGCGGRTAAGRRLRRGAHATRRNKADSGAGLTPPA